MSNNLHLLPRRWFAPREAALRASNAATMPLHDEIDKIFQNMFYGMGAPWDAAGTFLPGWRAGERGADLAPLLDLTSDDKAYELRVELPGVAPENVTVEVRENALVVSGEKKRETEEEKKDQHVVERMFGSFQRVLALPEDADVDAIVATHKNGVLSVTIPRRTVAKPAARTIEVNKE